MFDNKTLKILNRIKSINNWVVVGAKALNHYGISRYTYDTDILVNPNVLIEILTVFREFGYTLVKEDESQIKATCGSSDFDILITGTSEYSNALSNRCDTYYTSLSGLLDMYLMSDKEQNQIDAVNLLRLNPTLNPSEEVLSIEFDRFNYYQEASLKPVTKFKPRSLEDELDLEALINSLE